MSVLARLEVANTARTLGTLLGAGLSPGAALQAAASRPGAPPILQLALLLSQAASDGSHDPSRESLGSQILTVLDRSTGIRVGRFSKPRIGNVAMEPDDIVAWRELALALRAAESMGSPVAKELDQMAEIFEQQVAIERLAEQVLASSRTSRSILLVLPMLGIGLSTALGFGVLQVLLLSPIGLCCLLGGVVLLIIAERWLTAMKRKALGEPDRTAWVLMIIGCGLSAGHSLTRAQEEADLQTSGLYPTLSVVERDHVAAICGRVAELAQTSGIPVLRLIRAEVVARLAEIHSQTLVRVAALDAKQILPLGLCSLPAFIFVTVIPMAVSVAGGLL